MVRIVLLLAVVGTSCAVISTPEGEVPRYSERIVDAGASDAGLDAGVPRLDAGTDAGMDAGTDAGTPTRDAGVITINPACPEHAALIVSTNLPTEITSRFLVHGSITVKNVGTSTWLQGGDVMLGSPDNDDPFVVNARVELPHDVAPGASVTFDLPLRAPEAPGAYVTDWQMIEEHRCWFGETFATTIDSLAPVATGQCTNPAPHGVDEIAAVVHVVGPNRITLDSTAKVCDRDYCSAIGFTDFRTCCPARAEGHPDVDVCNAAMVGTATDTGRVGPTWTFNGQLCGPNGPGQCDNHPTNQFLLFVYGPGTARACSNTNGVCGVVIVP